MSNPTANLSETEASLEADPHLSATVRYHLGELALARDPTHPRHLMPRIADHHRVILDIGCGIGQTFVGAGLNNNADRTLIGLDYDLEPLRYGARHMPGIGYVNADANSLPIASGSVDLVVSRVSLPYTNLPVSMAEIERVLKPGGEIWITLHSLKILINPLMGALGKWRIKGVLVRLFYLLNGLLLHCTGRLMPLPGRGVYESFQTNGAMRRLLRRLGFVQVKIQRDAHFLVTARKPEA